MATARQHRHREITRIRPAVTVILTAALSTVLCGFGVPDPAAVQAPQESSAVAVVRSSAAQWTRTWGTALGTAAPASESKVTGQQTVRMVVHSSIAGSTARIHLANTFSTEPVTIGHATIARQDQGAAAQGTPLSLTFGGARQVEIQPGESIDSDPAAFPVKADENLLVSIYLPQPVASAPYHEYTLTTSYTSAPGDTTDQAAASGSKSFPARFRYWAYLSGLDVTASAGGGTVVAIGDSQTDGGHTTPDTNQRWTDAYGRALQKSARPSGIVNAGISGNRLLTDSTGTRAFYGPSVLHRFDRDALAQPNATHVILYSGVNDILYDDATSEALVAAVRDLAARAHTAGLTFTVATLPAFEGNPDYSPAKEQVRQEYNRYIRTTHDIDSYVDFDQATRDPLYHTRLFAGYYTRGDDRLHLNDNGNQAMANALAPAPATRPAPRYTQTRAADFDRDGTADLIARDGQGNLYLWPGNQDIDAPQRGDGTFGRPRQLTGGWNFTETTAGDFTGDGKPDLIAKDSANNLSLWAGRGDGSFDRPRQLTGGWNFTETTAGDYTGDGKPDLIAKDSANNLSLWAGRGDGSFDRPRQLTGGWNFTETTAGDYTGDGKPDLIAKDGQGDLYIWKANGNSTFRTKELLSHDWAFTQTTAGAFRGPGHDDLIARSDTTGDLNQWQNDGTTQLTHPLRLTNGW
ncbi:FG-GAP-like repeat-containing protein [Streptomyces sp. BPTC-684]|uniref:FG-GAP-like repeat-containing protein n=1 Tax=Streptomyces sp. BPTC-684 TaxID=3043734 RepID=UPI0024B1A12E|nr:FG-GAP-like repeat-containing protein [Streptomyces sp. BPTC-684]WHM36625.1 FG-GAP-like repeat-containing protein [Streptomyces sp. BPTC-684]